MRTSNPLSEDLDYILDSTRPLWEEVRGKSLFITGGTGFFGCWILESFLWANEKLKLGASAMVLTRNLEAFKLKAPHLAESPAISFEIGDVCCFKFPSEKFDFVIHAATDVYNRASPLRAIETIISGTKNVLDFAKHCRAEKFLLTSSGAVYGRQPESLARFAEEYSGAPDLVNPGSAYGEGKRVAELLCAIYDRENPFEVKIARCFAFVGPYLQLDGHLAIGNFIKNSLEGKSIEISGDGTPVRSYMYAGDLAVWLWTILLQGKACYPYNVGSEDGITLFELAQKISNLAGGAASVRVASAAKTVRPERYVPSTRRAQESLGLRPGFGLEISLEKTLKYYNGKNA